MGGEGGERKETCSKVLVGIDAHGEHLYVGPTGFRLAPSNLTLDDLRGQKSMSYFLT